jgi:DNA-binding NarL/FixJ family response regulator
MRPATGSSITTKLGMKNIEPSFSRGGHAPQGPITVLVVDDHVLLREGVRAVVGTQADMAIVGEAESGMQAIEQFAVLRPDVVLMDLQMPDMAGLEAIEAIRKLDGNARILVLTTYAGDGRAMKALQAGAKGYLLKGTLRKELLNAIRSVHSGGKHLDAQVATDIAIHALDGGLTKREIAVLSLAAWGNSNKQIAARLELSEETVKGHMKMVFGKLGVSDRTHAVTVAVKRGLIEL